MSHPPPRHLHRIPLVALLRFCLRTGDGECTSWSHGESMLAGAAEYRSTEVGTRRSCLGIPRNAGAALATRASTGPRCHATVSVRLRRTVKFLSVSRPSFVVLAPKPPLWRFPAQILALAYSPPLPAQPLVREISCVDDVSGGP